MIVEYMILSSSLADNSHRRGSWKTESCLIKWATAVASWFGIIVALQLEKNLVYRTL
jgi:hypothetical protein